MATSLPTIPSANVAKHSDSRSCYVTVGCNVYDVTDFLDQHPGGGELILQYGGKDVSEIMNDEISHTHSENAYEALNELLIGHMVTEAIEEAIVEHNQPDDIYPLLPNDAGQKVLDANVAAKKDMQANEIFSTTGLSGPQDLYKPTNEKQDFEEQKFLDLRKPLLMQVWRSGYSKEFYLEQVHRPRIIKGGASPPLFGNQLEFLSLTPFWVVPMIWLPCVAYGTWKANTGLPTPLLTAAYFFTGLFLWSLVEYGMHRGLFHVDKYLPDNRVGITGHFLLHGIHHYLPMDKYRLVMPPALFVVLAAPFHKLAHTVFYWDWFAATAVFCGGIFGYVMYDETHYFLHHKNLPAYYRQLKKYHLAHHWADYENGFGVTSRFWDVMFGTELADKPPKAAKAA